MCCVLGPSYHVGLGQWQSIQLDKQLSFLHTDPSVPSLPQAFI